MHLELPRGRRFELVSCQDTCGVACVSVRCSLERDIQGGSRTAAASAPKSQSMCGAASIDPAVVSKREGSEAAEARRSSEKPVAVNQQQYSHAIQGKTGSSDVGSEPAEPARTNAPPRRA